MPYRAFVGNANCWGPAEADQAAAYEECCMPDEAARRAAHRARICGGAALVRIREKHLGR